MNLGVHAFNQWLKGKDEGEIHFSIIQKREKKSLPL